MGVLSVTGANPFVKVTFAVDQLKAAFRDKFSPLFACEFAPNDFGRNFCIEKRFNVLGNVIARELLGGRVHFQLGFHAQFEFGIIEAVFEEFVEVSEDFRPKLINIILRQAGHSRAVFGKAFNHGIAAVAGHVGKTHAVIGRDSEDAMPFDGGRPLLISATTFINRRINK